MNDLKLNNRWFGGPRLFGLVLAIGFSAVVWCLIYLAVSGRWANPEGPGASSQTTVKLQPQDADKPAPKLEPDAVRTE